MLVVFKEIDRISRVVLLTLLACFLCLVFTTWLKWGDLIVDTFRDPLLVLKILDGEVVYRDFFFEYGIFPLYFLTGIFKIFGVKLSTMVGCGMVLTILMSVVLYRISRFFLDTIVSGLVVFTFLFVFAFGFYCYNGIFNFILPYSFASVCSIFFVVLAFFFFLKYIFSDGDQFLLLWAFAISFAVFSRITMPFCVWLGFVGVWALLLFKDRSRRNLRSVIYIVLPLFICISTYALFILKSQAFPQFKESIIDHIFQTRTNFFVMLGMGFDNVGRNVLLLLKSIFLHAVVVFLFAAASNMISSFFSDSKKAQARLLSGVILIVFLFSLSRGFVSSSLQYRGVPLLLIFGLFISFRGVLRSADYKKDLAKCALFLISLLTLLRIILNTTPVNYGFYLMCLAIPSYYVVFFEISKHFIRRRFPDFSEPLFTSLLICFFIVLALNWWGFSYSMYKNKRFKIRTDKGEMLTWNDNRSKRSVEVIKYLKENTSENDKVIVIPEGQGISFFSERRNPLRYTCMFPSVLAVTGEDSVITEFADSHADYIVIVQRPTVEYGASSFGVNYFQRLNAWIKENYRLEKTIGPYPFTTRDFGIAIYKKKQ